MKNPLIFGLSDAEEVADGSVVTEQNDDVISVSTSGDVSKKNIVEIVNHVANSTGGGSVQSGSFTLSYDDLPSGNNQHKGFLFDSESIVDISGYATGTSDIYLESNIVWADSGAKMQELGIDGTANVNFAHMTVPTTGYQNVAPANIMDDLVYAIKLPNNTYALVKNISSTSTTDGAGGLHTTLTCDYKYRDDGGVDF